MLNTIHDFNKYLSRSYCVHCFGLQRWLRKCSCPQRADLLQVGSKDLWLSQHYTNKHIKKIYSSDKGRLKRMMDFKGFEVVGTEKGSEGELSLTTFIFLMFQVTSLFSRTEGTRVTPRYKCKYLVFQFVHPFLILPEGETEAGCKSLGGWLWSLTWVFNPPESGMLTSVLGKESIYWMEVPLGFLFQSAFLVVNSRTQLPMAKQNHSEGY